MTDENNNNIPDSELPLEKQYELAEQIKLLWGFIYTLKEHRDLFERIAKDAERKAHLAESAAVLNPFGYKTSVFKHTRVARRARLLVELLDTLEETDKEVAEAEQEEKSREKMKDIFDFF